jgi:hypothetical protein
MGSEGSNLDESLTEAEKGATVDRAQTMTSATDKYTYCVTWSDDAHEYVGLCPEFPSLSWLSPSRDEALRGVEKSGPTTVRSTLYFAGAPVGLRLARAELSVEQ